MLWRSSNTQSFGWNIRRSYCVHAENETESVWIGHCCLREKQKTPSIKGFSTTSSTNKFAKRNQRWEICLCTQHYINITDTLHSASSSTSLAFLCHCTYPWRLLTLWTCYTGNDQACLSPRPLFGLITHPESPPLQPKCKQNDDHRTLLMIYHYILVIQNTEQNTIGIKTTISISASMHVHI